MEAIMYPIMYTVPVRQCGKSEEFWNNFPPEQVKQMIQMQAHWDAHEEKICSSWFDCVPNPTWACLRKWSEEEAAACA